MAIAKIERDGIEDGAIDGSKILDGILGATDIPNDSLTNAKFSNSAVIPTSKLTGLATSATTDTTNATNITSGSLATARVDVGTTAGKILQVDGSGNLPAVDGSLLTGVVGAIKSSSDPTISTNPSGGVGTEWHNKTTGQMYICTDATAGANVWSNVGAGSGNIVPYFFQGTQYGFVYGGTYPTSADIQKWSFTSDGNATDVGDQSVQRQSYSASSSATYGYCHGGAGPSNVIDKFQFTVGGTMTDVGNLTAARTYPSGMTSNGYGWAAGGAGYLNVIERYSHTSDGNSTDWADLFTGTSAASNGVSATDYGYTAGGAAPGTNTNTIQKFVFATQTNGTDVGDLLYIVSQSGATSSSTHGYIMGGNQAPTTNTIQKFPYASDSNSTDVGDIFSDNGKGIFLPGNASSTTYGYRAGGDDVAGGTAVNVIDKHSFTTDGNATDVGNLAHVQNYMGQGSQY